MKRFLLVLIVALGLSSCVSKIQDIPSVTFEESEYTVTKDGGELIIPVRSTGVDQVRITYRGGENWDIDENGDMTPTEGWCKLVKVINRYETRDLPEWRSGIYLNIEPNNTKVERVVYIQVDSFQATDVVTVRQNF